MLPTQHLQQLRLLNRKIVKSFDKTYYPNTKSALKSLLIIFGKFWSIPKTIFLPMSILGTFKS